MRGLLVLAMSAAAVATLAAEPTKPQAPPGMAKLPGGTFVMGTGQGHAFEGPPHQVMVKPFSIAQRNTVEDGYLRRAPVRHALTQGGFKMKDLVYAVYTSDDFVKF